MRTPIAIVVLAACSQQPEAGEVLPSFALRDVNPTSNSFDQVVSTDSQAARTAWYFGHAT